MGDMSQVLSSSILNGVQNGYNIDDTMEEDNPSLALINEIASSLSNQMIPRAPPPPPPPKPAFNAGQFSSLEDSASAASAGRVVTSTDAASEASIIRRSSIGREYNSSDSQVTDTNAVTTPNSRASFKRVSKLNRTHPSISYLDDTSGYDPGLAFINPPINSALKNESQTVPQPMDLTDSIDTSNNVNSNSDFPFKPSNKGAPSCPVEVPQNTPNQFTKAQVTPVANSFVPCTNYISPSQSNMSPHVPTTNFNNNNIPSAPVRSISNSSNISTSSSTPPSGSRHNSCSSLHSGSGLSHQHPNSNMHSHTPTQSCSSLRSVEEDGDSVLLMEKRSFRPFKSSEDYLYAMREDLAEWLKCLYELGINADNFFELLETGEVLCQVSC